MIRINLLPVRTSRRRETAQRQLVIGLIGLAVVVAVCVGLQLKVSADISAAEQENAEIEAEVNRLKKVIGQVEEYEKKKDALKKKLDIIAKLKAGKTGPVHMLDELATRIPEKAWLKSISEVNKKLTLTGFAINNEVIADFISRLEESGYFDDVYLVSTRQKDNKKRGQSKNLSIKLKEFNITARLTSPQQKKAAAEAAAKAGAKG